MPYQLIEVTAILTTQEWVMVEDERDKYTSGDLARRRWEERLDGAIREANHDFELEEVQTSLLRTQDEVPDTVFITERGSEIVEVEP